ncbi:uncharacterized protein BDR25DRAFT_366519 [Lindgomyces ingoldianus]|uniref:Uncharacterized protein n=1 Tax=Lindgomyces ingoldianus TaxID=673940 RepID=A0ACB6R118_9PLEO|nr:uncharacterized protein BDR25DRAFT_366519 [Lindgomyces ingoldianus]KAF2472523.1 hypothetical protein BDR25DRAFT_366519 [Lindgomyces ingoldianus]
MSAPRLPKPFTQVSKLAQNSSSDIEQAPDTARRYLEGFPSLSALLASDPDLQVYRRFNRLASRNLLYLQAEILDLETRLNDFDAEDLEIANAEEDGGGWMEVKLNARCWEIFREKAEQGEEKERERMRLIREIRERMAEYQDALIRQSTLLNLENPNPRVRGAVTGWFDLNKPLVGHSKDMFNGKAKYDTVALRTPADQDRLTMFLQNYLGYLFRHRKTNKDYPLDWEGMYYFPETTIKHIVSFTSVLLAAALLVGAITSLYFVKKPSNMIGLLAAFTTMFAGSVGLLTNARKVDIYAATAAYAAVLVVFVGNLGIATGPGSPS